jgi:hypothetical protein
MSILRSIPRSVVLSSFLALSTVAQPSMGFAQIEAGVTVMVPPPAIPVYAQPPIVAPGYIWVPGYWSYTSDGYYWVPGTWELPPDPGLLWTPGYWGWADGAYVWHAGYWGPHVGFYGGVDYGFGYDGVGYQGGYWDHDKFFYNRAVNNVGSANFANVYSKPVRDGRGSRVSFNGGKGGTRARPTAQDQAATNDRHVAPTAPQTQHEHVAAGNRSLFASVNHGRPAIAATSKPGVIEKPVAQETTARTDHAAPTHAAVLEPHRPQAASREAGPPAAARPGAERRPEQTQRAPKPEQQHAVAQPPAREERPRPAPTPPAPQHAAVRAPAQTAARPTEPHPQAAHSAPAAKAPEAAEKKAPERN